MKRLSASVAIIAVVASPLWSQTKISIDDGTGLKANIMTATLASSETMYFLRGENGKYIATFTPVSSTQGFTTGDLPYADAGNPSFLTRLGIGTTAYALTVVGGLPAWAILTLPGGGTGLASYTQGDMLYKGASSTAFSKLGIGTVGDLLHVTSGNAPSWIGVISGTTGGATPANGDLVYYNSSYSTAAYDLLNIGSSGQILTVSGGLPVWASPSSIAHVVINNPDATTSTSHNLIRPTVNAVPLWLETYTNGTANLLTLIHDTASTSNTVAQFGANGQLTITPDGDEVPISITKLGGSTTDVLQWNGNQIISPAGNLNSPGGTVFAGTVSNPGVLYLQAAAGGVAGLDAAPAMSVSQTWHLPVTEGTNGQVLKTNGSGQLSFTSVTTGTVTSISAGTGITLTPNPIVTTGTVALTSPVAIANGGTNATTAYAGLTSLGGIHKNPTASTDNFLQPGNGTTDALSLVQAASGTQDVLVWYRADLGASHTLFDNNGIAGVLAGGTGLATLTAHALIAGNGVSAPNFIAPSTSGNILTSNGTDWTSAANTSVTNPMTTTGDIIYSSDNSGTPARRGIGGANTVIHGGTIPTYSAIVNGDLTAGSFTNITGVGTLTAGTWNATTIAVNKGGTGQTSYTNGQLLIGNTTGNTLAKATLTAGSGGISITNGSGTITITNTGCLATSSGTQDLGQLGTPNFGGLTIGGLGAPCSIFAENGQALTVGTGNSSTGTNSQAHTLDLETGTSTGNAGGAIQFSLPIPGTSGTGVNAISTVASLSTATGVPVLSVGGVPLVSYVSTGTATLVAGTILIADANVTAASVIHASATTFVNPGAYFITAIVAGVSFTVTSTNVLDASTIGYVILK